MDRAGKHGFKPIFELLANLIGDDAHIGHSAPRSQVVGASEYIDRAGAAGQTVKAIGS
jgi:hypothetical protein